VHRGLGRTESTDRDRGTMREGKKREPDGGSHLQVSAGLTCHRDPALRIPPQVPCIHMYRCALSSCTLLQCLQSWALEQTLNKSCSVSSETFGTWSASEPECKATYGTAAGRFQ